MALAARGATRDGRGSAAVDGAVRASHPSSLVLSGERRNERAVGAVSTTSNVEEQRAGVARPVHEGGDGGGPAAAIANERQQSATRRDTQANVKRKRQTGPRRAVAPLIAIRRQTRRWRHARAAAAAPETAVAGQPNGIASTTITSASRATAVQIDAFLAAVERRAAPLRAAIQHTKECIQCATQDGCALRVAALQRDLESLELRLAIVAADASDGTAAARIDAVTSYYEHRQRKRMSGRSARHAQASVHFRDAVLGAVLNGQPLPALTGVDGGATCDFDVDYGAAAGNDAIAAGKNADAASGRCSACGALMCVGGNDSLLVCPRCLRARELPTSGEAVLQLERGEGAGGAAAVSKQLPSRPTLLQKLDQAQGRAVPLRRRATGGSTAAADAKLDALLRLAASCLVRDTTGGWASRMEALAQRITDAPADALRDANELRDLLRDDDLYKRALESLDGVALDDVVRRLGADDGDEHGDALRACRPQMTQAAAKKAVDELRKRAAHYATLLTGLTLPQFSPAQTAALCDAYAAALPVYQKVAASSGRVTWAHGYPYFIRCVCWARGWHTLAGLLPLRAARMSDATAAKRQRAVRALWAKLGWEWRGDGDTDFGLADDDNATTRNGADRTRTKGNKKRARVKDDDSDDDDDEYDDDAGDDSDDDSSGN